MLAVVADRYGPPEVLTLRDVPDPVPGPGQVRVRVRASSLNPLDEKLLSGSLRPFLRLRFPAVVGFDLAGDVESLGPGAQSFAVGDRVYGRIERLTGGAHATLAVAGAAVLDRVPEALSYEQAAALPLVGMTALRALRESAGLREGHRLLVIGGAGGVGSHAIQIGRALGAIVTAVVNAAAAPLAMRLGAEEVLDRASDELDRTDRRFDVVLDTAFTRPFRVYRRVLAPGGTYVTTGFSPGLAVTSLIERLRGHRVRWVISRADGKLMRDLSALVAARSLEPVIDSTWPLEDVREAYAKLTAGHLRGKIVVAMP